MTPKEEWRAVPGYEGLYEVSSLGRVRSLDRVVYTVRYHAASGPRRILGYYLRARSNPAGYPMVDLQRDSKPTAMAVHAIVALAFLGPRPDGYEVAHGNGDRADARLENLRYATPKENQADRYLHGTAIDRKSVV